MSVFILSVRDLDMGEILGRTMFVADTDDQARNAAVRSVSAELEISEDRLYATIDEIFEEGSY